MIVLQLQGLRATGWCDNCFLLLDNKTLREEGRERRSTALPEGPTYIRPSFTSDHRPVEMFPSNEKALLNHDTITTQPRDSYYPIKKFHSVVSNSCATPLQGLLSHCSHVTHLPAQSLRCPHLPV